MFELLGTIEEFKKLVEENKNLPHHFQMKLNFLVQEKDNIANSLASMHSRIEQLGIVLAGVKEQYIKKAGEVEEVLAEMELTTKEEQAWAERIKQEDLEDQELEAEMEMIKRDLLYYDEEELKLKIEAENVKEEIVKAHTETRKMNNRVQNVKGNVRVAVRIKPEPVVAPKIQVKQVKTQVMGTPPKPEQLMIELDEETDELVIRMPPMVVLFNPSSRNQQTRV